MQHIWPHTRLAFSVVAILPGVLRESVLWLLHFTLHTLSLVWSHARLANSVAAILLGVLRESVFTLGNMTLVARLQVIAIIANAARTSSVKLRAIECSLFLPEVTPCALIRGACLLVLLQARTAT